MKIATTTGDFDNYVAAGTDVCEKLQMLADSGFRHIDLNMYQVDFEGSPFVENTWESWAYDIANTGARLGLDFVQAHGSDSAYDAGELRRRRMDMIANELRVCKMLGIPGMVVHAVCRPDSAYETFMQANAAFYGELMKAAEETGVAVYAENTCAKNNPTCFLLESRDMNELRDRMNNHPLFGLCWDVGHAHIQGVDQYKAILDMGDGLKAVHIHDNLGKDTHGQPYSGSCAYDPIVKGLIDSGYNGYFTLEANSIPAPAGFIGRKPLVLDGVVCDRLLTLPLSLKLRSESLMHDIARYMLESYGVYES